MIARPRIQRSSDCVHRSRAAPPESDGLDVLARLQALEMMEDKLGRTGKRRDMPLALMRVMRAATSASEPVTADRDATRRTGKEGVCHPEV
jgi:hypothetical protein